MHPLEQTRQELKEMAEAYEQLNSGMENTQAKLGTKNNQAQSDAITEANEEEQIKQNFDINNDNILSKEDFINAIKKGESLFSELIIALKNLNLKKLKILMKYIDKFSFMGCDLQQDFKLGILVIEKKDTLRIAQILLILKIKMRNTITNFYEIDKQKEKDKEHSEFLSEQDSKEIMNVVGTGLEHRLQLLENVLEGYKINEIVYFNPDILTIFEYIDKNNKEAIKKLVSEKSIDINSIHLQKNLNPLLYAISNLNYEMVQFLLDLRADPNVQTLNYMNGLEVLIVGVTTKICAPLLGKSKKFDPKIIQTAEQILDALICYGFIKPKEYSQAFLKTQKETQWVIDNDPENPNRASKTKKIILGAKRLYQFLSSQKERYFWLKQESETFQKLTTTKFQEMSQEVACEKDKILFKYRTSLSTYLSSDTTNLVLSYLPIEAEAAETRLKEQRYSKFWQYKI